MIKWRNESINPREWWQYSNYIADNSSIKYQPPVCKDSEHRFLFYLYELQKAVNRGLVSSNEYLAPVTVYKYDKRKQKTKAIAIKKDNNLLEDNRNYFGNGNLLIITGPLSGTIGKEIKKRRRKTSIESIRPIINHPDVIKYRIEVDIEFKKTHNNIETATNMEVIRDLIFTTGYIPSLLHLIALLCKDADLEVIRQNSA